MRILPAAVFALLLGISAAGCLQQPTSIPVPAPSPGATFVYMSEDGRTLRVEVLEDAVRRDMERSKRDVIRIGWTIDFLGHEYRMWESVDPSTGLIVQQVARCGKPYDEAFPRGDDDRRCMDERALVLLSGGGLPGAFGAGPFWGRNESGDGVRDTRIDVQSLWTSDDLAYTVEPQTWNGRRCIKMKSNTPAEPLRTMPQTVVGGPFTLCSGIAFPIAFSTTGGSTFKLRNWSQGHDNPFGHGSPVLSEPNPLDRRNWSDPLVVNPSDNSPFPPREAHRYAMNNESRYRRLIQDGGLVVATQFRVTGSSEVGPGLAPETTYSRRLEAFAPDGRVLRLKLAKENRSIQSDRIHIENITRSTLDHPPTMESLAQRQADIVSVRGYAREVIGTAASRAGFGQWASIPDHPWGEGAIHRTPRDDGYTVVVWNHDPTPVFAGVEAPYQMAVDGPSGAVLWFTYNRTRLPYD